ncbi:MAG TPA: efflux RND transporter periplasmic adaptor subunit [bacterium]|nr:efflux RND transporter periplasmic adaptor subunit [bacterium]
MNEETKVKKPVGRYVAVASIVLFFALGYVLILVPKGQAASHEPAAKTEMKIDGTLEADETDVSSKLPGRIAKMYVDEGDQVKAGQVLAVLEAEELDAKHDQASAGVRASEVLVNQGEIAVNLEGRKAEDQVRQARAGVEASEAALGMASQKLAALVKGARPQEIKQAEQGVAAAQAQFDTAKKTYDRVVNLSNEGVLAQQKQDEAEMAYRSSDAQLTAAKARLDLVREGARKEEIIAAREQVRQAMAGVEAAKQTFQLAIDARSMVDIRSKDVEAARQKVAASEGTLREVEAYRKQTRIVSPISGTVTQRMSRAGEIVAPGYAIFSVTRTDRYWVEVYVDESKFAGHKIGETVQVELPALGKMLPGKIVRVLPSADFATKKATDENGTFDVRALQMRINLLENPPELATGLTARVHFGK